MKTSLKTVFAFVTLAAGSGAVEAQLPAGCSVAVTQGTGGANAVRVRLTDAGDNLYVLQGSTDLVNWTSVETWKVHNGSFEREFTQDPVAVPAYFYRAFYDPARTDVTSTVANALLLPAVADNYANPTLPAGFLVAPFSTQDNTPVTNPVTDAGAKLGRVLFYDKRLSLNRTVSCSSCHQAEHGFSDPRQFSVGFEGGLTDRNSMGLTNARWYQRRAFFWDERAATLEDQVLQPIQNATEMGMTLDGLVTRLSTEPYYATLFTGAFGTSTVTSERISLALAQFVRSIISTKSKFDLGRAAAPQFSNFTTEERAGQLIFNNVTTLASGAKATCNACHGTDNFAPTAAINNNGLEDPYIDEGLGAVTGRAGDIGKFKAPSLRNIELTAPYMHDGRFATLEATVDFYSTGVVNHANLSPPLRAPGGGAVTPLRLNLTAAESAALVAFLKTLTDTSVTTDAKFSDPFNYGDAL